jgi:hypothetical protein
MNPGLRRRSRGAPRSANTRHPARRPGPTSGSAEGHSRFRCGCPISRDGSRSVPWPHVDSPPGRPSRVHDSGTYRELISDWFVWFGAVVFAWRFAGFRGGGSALSAMGLVPGATRHTPGHCLGLSPRLEAAAARPTAHRAPRGAAGQPGGGRLLPRPRFTYHRCTCLEGWAKLDLLKSRIPSRSFLQPPTPPSTIYIYSLYIYIYILIGQFGHNLESATYRTQYEPKSS